MLNSLIPFLLALSLQGGVTSVTPSTPTPSISPISNQTAPLNQNVNVHSSTNWAGYTAREGSYTGVGSTWTIPSVSASATPGMSTDATWVGIGGFSTTDLIQAGTQAIVENGQVTYSAWYETLPAYQEQIPLTIHAGDSVTVSLTQTTPGMWYLSFIDNTTGKSYGRTIAYNSSNSSAEWIEERPIVDAGRGFSLIPLDDFGSISFTNGYAIKDGVRENLSQAGATALSMVGSGQTLAITSGLDASGSFTVSRGTGSTGSLAATNVSQQQIAPQTISPAHASRRGRFGNGGGNYVIYITYGSGETRVLEL